MVVHVTHIAASLLHFGEYNVQCSQHCYNQGVVELTTGASPSPSIGPQYL